MECLTLDKNKNKFNYSISLEKDKAERFLPLAKKYGAMFIALPVGPKGLPDSLEEKHRFIDELCDKAYKMGLTKEDIEELRQMFRVEE